MTTQKLKTQLFKRTQFLQACLRQQIPLAAILPQRTWREELLGILNGRPREGNEYWKADAVNEAGGGTESRASVYEPVENAELLHDVAKLVREHFLNRFVFFDKPVDGDDKEESESGDERKRPLRMISALQGDLRTPNLANWEAWTEWEVLIYYDATLLEIVANTALPGELGIQALQDTVCRTRTYYATFGAQDRDVDDRPDPKERLVLTRLSPLRGRIEPAPFGRA